MPDISNTTAINGAAHLMTTSPYRVTAQKPQTKRKLSHGSPVVQDNRPTALFSDNKNGWEYASTLVICGGVATSNGDF